VRREGERWERNILGSSKAEKEEGGGGVWADDGGEKGGKG